MASNCLLAFIRRPKANHGPSFIDGKLSESLDTIHRRSCLSSELHEMYENDLSQKSTQRVAAVREAVLCGRCKAGGLQLDRCRGGRVRYPQPPLTRTTYGGPLRAGDNLPCVNRLSRWLLQPPSTTIPSTT